MSIKGTLDPMHLAASTTALMRDSGRYFQTGWWGVDDDFAPHIGPYPLLESCQKACDEHNQ